MSNNVIARGFNALSKLIGRGYGKKSRVGIKVCMRVFDKPHIAMKVKTK